MNLYKVYNKLGEFYTIAKDFGEAQHNIEEYLAKEDYGLFSKRKTINVTIIASDVIVEDLPTLVIKQ